MRDKIIYFLAVIISIVYIIVGNKIASTNFKSLNESENTFLKAQVKSIIEENITNETNNNEDISNKYEAILLDGENKGEEIVFTQVINELNKNSSDKISIGDNVIVTLEKSESGEKNFSYVERVRTDGLILLGTFFIVLLLIFGKSKGINTILSLVFTLMSIFLIYIPAILSGKNIYIYSITTCIFIILSTLLIVYGLNKKSMATALGCFGGLLVSGILILITNYLFKLTGLVDEESVFLLYLNVENAIDLKAIIFGSVLVGAIGAIMDVAVDISSALSEITEKIKKPTFTELFKSGINIGQDIMGTMTNTLVLAYMGSSLSSVLLITAYNNSMLYVLNKEMIVVEILQALIGSIGLIFTIPFTSFVCALIYSRKKDVVDIVQDITDINIKA